LRKLSGVERVGKFLLYLHTMLLLVPLVWITITAFKSLEDLFTNPMGLPKVWHFENFIQAIRVSNLHIYIKNTLFVEIVTLGCVLLVATFVSFALSRFNFRFKDGLYIFFTAGYMISLHSVLIPLYEIARNLHAFDNLFFLSLVYSAFEIPFSVLILTSFMSQVPKEIEESAIIDGCSYWGIYSKIVIPLSKDGIIAVATLVALHVWNELLLALVFLNKSSSRTLPVGMRGFFAEYISQPTLLFAAALTVSIPIMIIYSLLQERFVQGITLGALKG